MDIPTSTAEKRWNRHHRYRHQPSSKMRMLCFVVGTLILIQANSTSAKRHHNVASVSHLPTAKAASALPMDGLRGGAGIHKAVATRNSRTTSTASSTKGGDKSSASLVSSLSKIDIGTFFMYFCTSTTMTLPVLIVPMMDVELLASSNLDTTTSGSRLPSSSAAVSLVATVASLAPFGGGVGKLMSIHGRITIESIVFYRIGLGVLGSGQYCSVLLFNNNN